MPVTFLTSDRPGTIITDPRFVGFEIECEYGSEDEYVWWKEAQVLPSANFDSDGSLSNGGLEVKTFPAQLQTLERVVKMHTRALKNAGFSVDYRCGCHTHVDARDFRDDPQAIVRLFQTVWACENVLYHLVSESRQNNHYCESLQKKYAFDDFQEASEDVLLEKLYKVNKAQWNMSDPRTNVSPMNNVKYNGLNIQSIFYRGTVEFRYHQGTLDDRKMLYWAALLQAFMKYAKNGFNLDSIRRLSKMKADQQFLNMCFLLSLSDQVKLYLAQRYLFLQKRRGEKSTLSTSEFEHSVFAHLPPYAEGIDEDMRTERSVIPGDSAVPF